MDRQFEVHDYAALVPMANAVEQDALTKDIKDHGLREPIVLWRGKVVDGRCRLKACKALGERIRIKELDDELDDAAVKAFVKSVNTRRNLTTTQKIMSACRVSLDKDNTLKLQDIAESWGISFSILKNARFIANNAPEYIIPLFNGEAVNIYDAKGNYITTNKITAVWAHIKRKLENVKEDDRHGWEEDSYIKTQAGKDWYYEQIRIANEVGGDMTYKQLVAELANYKFEGELDG